MITLVSGFLGGVAGAAVTILVCAAWRSRRPSHRHARSTTPEQGAFDEPLSRHADVMQQHVSNYADNLAGDDTSLRSMLRRFERGGLR